MLVFVGLHVWFSEFYYKTHAVSSEIFSFLFLFSTFFLFFLFSTFFPHTLCSGSSFSDDFFFFFFFLMLVFAASFIDEFSYTTYASFSEEFVLHDLILCSVRSFSYTTHARFSEEFLLHFCC